MSLISMTGYGRGSASRYGVTINVELNTVNRKQLDIQVSLPKMLHMLQARLHKTIGEAIHRGRVTGELTVAWSAPVKRKAVEVDEDLAQAFIDALKHAAAKLGLSENMSAEILFELPEVVNFVPPIQDTEKLWSVAQSALLTALRELIAMRKQEGQELQKDLEARIRHLAQLVKAIQQRAPQAQDQRRLGLIERIKKAELEIDVDDERLQREIVFYADRLDITEELVRLGSHLKQAKKLFRAGGTSGKTLDFLAQEMFREINTIGSKSSDAEIATQVVTFKAELEKIREQVQNIE